MQNGFNLTDFLIEINRSLVKCGELFLHPSKAKAQSLLNLTSQYPFDLKMGPYNFYCWKLGMQIIEDSENLTLLPLLSPLIPQLPLPSPLIPQLQSKKTLAKISALCANIRDETTSFKFTNFEKITGLFYIFMSSGSMQIVMQIEWICATIIDLFSKMSSGAIIMMDFKTYSNKYDFLRNLAVDISQLFDSIANLHQNYRDEITNVEVVAKMEEIGNKFATSFL